MASEPVLPGQDSPVGEVRRERGPGPIRRLAYALLVLECIVILIPSIYGRLTPKLFGIAFFYWFQLAWILVAMVVTGIVYLLTTLSGRPPGEPRPARRRIDRGGAQ